VRPRDAAIFGIVLLIAGFAVADAFRAAGGDGSERSSATTTDERLEPTTGTGETVDVVRDPFIPVPAPGLVIFTDRNDCRVRAARAQAGIEAALPLIGRSCELWAAPTGAFVAYGLGRASRDGDAVPFRFAALGRPVRVFGGYHALFGFVAWSADGRRAAWCGRSRTGLDVEVGGRARRLPRCPAAYTPEGEIAYAVANTVVIEDRRTAVRAPTGITFVQWGRDGSSVVVGLDGRRLARYDRRGRLEGIFDVPDGRIPILSPDNCASAFRQGDGRVRVVDLGCFRGRTIEVVGEDIAWSPDGEWVVVAAPDSLVFHRLVGTPEMVRWPAQAAEVAWR
jgi:hypothetical protein